MKMIVAGLGNPGPAYERTRHNIGFDVVGAWALREKFEFRTEKRFNAEVAQGVFRGRSVLLMKPMTYMNESGRAIVSASRFFRIPPERVVVIYDEYQVPVGRVRLTLKGGPGGHNGVSSIISHIGPEFVRYRIGIGPKEKPMAAMKEFVLGKFSPEEAEVIRAAMPGYLEGLDQILIRGPEIAMNTLNQRRKGNEPDSKTDPKL